METDGKMIIAYYHFTLPNIATDVTDSAPHNKETNIPHVIQSYETLFNQQRTWLYNLGSSGVQLLIGCNFHHFSYTRFVNHATRTLRTAVSFDTFHFKPKMNDVVNIW